jgi:hypothetical protein
MRLDLWWARQRGREDIDDQAFGRAPTAHNLAAALGMRKKEAKDALRSVLVVVGDDVRERPEPLGVRRQVGRLRPRHRSL